MTVEFPVIIRAVRPGIVSEFSSETAIPIYTGDIDFTRVIAILKKAGYTNDLCIEDESLGNRTDAAETLAKELRLLKKLR